MKYEETMPVVQGHTTGKPVLSLLRLCWDGSSAHPVLRERALSLGLSLPASPVQTSVRSFVKNGNLHLICGRQELFFFNKVFFLIVNQHHHRDHSGDNL